MAREIKVFMRIFLGLNRILTCCLLIHIMDYAREADESKTHDASKCAHAFRQNSAQPRGVFGRAP
jgi:hypothetical protein